MLLLLLNLSHTAHWEQLQGRSFSSEVKKPFLSHWRCAWGHSQLGGGACLVPPPIGSNSEVCLASPGKGGVKNNSSFGQVQHNQPSESEGPKHTSPDPTGPSRPRGSWLGCAIGNVTFFQLGAQVIDTFFCYCYYFICLCHHQYFTFLSA